MKTNLEIFNQVRDHLLKQGRRSIARYSHAYSYGDCRYRGENGMSCAVGCLIPDELYDPEIESQFAGSQIVRAVLKKVDIWDNNIGMLMNLQTVHDSAESWDNFPHNMNKKLEQIQARWC